MCSREMLKNVVRSFLVLHPTGRRIKARRWI